MNCSAGSRLEGTSYPLLYSQLTIREASRYNWNTLPISFAWLSLLIFLCACINTVTQLIFDCLLSFMSHYTTFALHRLHTSKTLFLFFFFFTKYKSLWEIHTEPRSPHRWWEVVWKGPGQFVDERAKCYGQGIKTTNFCNNCVFSTNLPCVEHLISFSNTEAHVP